MFVIDVPYFSIRQTFFSKQSLLWSRYDRNADHTRYTIQHKDRLLGVAQRGNRLILNCDEDEFFDYWFAYFDLGTDYMQTNSKVGSLQSFIKDCSDYGSGVHVINSGAHEAILTTILLYQQYVSEAKKLMAWLCENFGVERRKIVSGLGSIKYYTVPTPEQIKAKDWLIGETFYEIDNPTNQDLQNMLTMDLLRMYIDDCCNGLYNPESVKDFDDEKLLMDLRMWDWLPTEKERKRVMLYGFGRKSIFPMSDYVAKKIKKHTRIDADIYVDWYLGDSDYKGFAYQYMMYKFINPIERLDKWVW